MPEEAQGTVAPEAAAEKIVIGEKEYTPEQAAALIEAGESAETSRAEVEAQARTVAEERGRLTELKANLEHQMEILKASPKSDERDKFDPDELVTEKRLREQLQDVNERLKQAEKLQDEKAAQAAWNESVALIDSTIEDCIANSKILSGPDVDPELIETIIIGTFSKNRPTGNTRAELSKHVKNIMVGVEKKVADFQQAAAKKLTTGKAGVSARVAQVPPGGVPGQKEEQFEPTMKGMRQWMGNLKRELDGTRPE